MKFIHAIFLVFSLLAAPAFAAEHVRARDLGVPFDGTPGPLNAITDVAGVEVGYKTIIKGSGKLVRGKGPVRTGVTAILPRGKTYDPVFAGWHALNGNGEMTGTTWVTESGFLEGPVMITNTHSVGVVHDAVIEWQVKHGFYEGLPGEPDVFWSLPVVAETWDGDLNDINGFHVTKKDAFAALDGAKSGAVGEGNVGGGTGMICHEFKGGTGTASRVLAKDSGGYTVGALVQANYGIRKTMRIAGVPINDEIPDLLPGVPEAEERGSIIVVLATDAPLLPHQLRRVAQRASLALGRMGSYASNGSGDIFIAFSTANSKAAYRLENQEVEFVPNDAMGPIFLAAVEATEEAIVNALVAAKTMTGADGYVVHALPHDRLRAALKKHGRLADAAE
ncbi:MAG: aminopeptidase [Alphaproteobacteria bacterium RIFCSPHIGHO2_12_FULL_63_12]|nr:MAG: aminopeptidase [Alphaproteobacteria bacterium RIFCSPHIGHO2_12_FULL_63_12]